MKVIRLNGISPREWLATAVNIYVGRRVYLRSGKNAGQDWPASVLANPFVVSNSIRAVVLADYEQYIHGAIEQKQARTIAAMQALTPDSVLGCWCVNSDSEDDPVVCHAQVIRAVWRERFAR